MMKKEGEEGVKGGWEGGGPQNACRDCAAGHPTINGLLAKS